MVDVSSFNVMRPVLRLIIFLSLLLTPVALVNGQEKWRTLHEAKYHLNAPISIVNREAGTRSFTGHSILAGPDWLNDLTLTVKNVSQKNIKKISIILTIPKQRNMPTDYAMYFYFYEVKRTVDADGKFVTHGETVVKLRPGETVRLKVPEQHLQILEEIKKYGVNDVESVRLSIQTIHFDDGTGWLTGLPAVEDPTKPGSLFIVKSGESNY